MEGFEFEISDETRHAIADMGYAKPTPIQELTVTPLLAGKDVIGQAQTGTGKTAAFGIPIVEKIDAADRRVQALILCPTRELAVQTAGEITKLGRYHTGLRALAVYGGQPIERQLRELGYGVQVIVGTPGRVMDHINRGSLDISQISICVLDEADEMLDMGFRDDIESILSNTPAARQTALFSATMPLPIMALAQKYLRDPAFLRVENRTMTVERIQQTYIQIRPLHKNELLARLLVRDGTRRALVFMNTRAGVEDVVTDLQKRGFAAAGLHGDMRQMERDAIMARFKAGLVQILIATDVAARGLDIDDVEAVFNYDVPLDVEQYVHRIGRTGRAGKEGRAYTFVVGRETLRMWDYRKLTGAVILIEQPPSGEDIRRAEQSRFMNTAISLASDDTLDTADAQTLLESAPAEKVVAALLKLLGDINGRRIHPELDIRVPEPPKPASKPAPSRRDHKPGRPYDARKDGERKFRYGKPIGSEHGPDKRKHKRDYADRRFEGKSNPRQERGFYDPRRGPKPDKIAQGRQSAQKQHDSTGES